MVRRWLIAVGLLAGCNQVWQLGETEVYVDPCPMDTDCDGVIDAADNCLEAVNESQEDADADGLGDACDACAMAFDATMDFDGDGVLPAEDRCPGWADPAQLDADADGVGDACDPDPGTAQALRCFTDFRNQVDVIHAWPPNASWKWLSRLMHTPAETPPFEIVAHGTRLPAAATVEAVYQMSASDLELATGVAVAASDGTLLARCELVRTAGGPLTLQLAIGGEVRASEPFEFLAHPQAIAIGYQATPAGTALRCAARSTGGAPTVVTAVTDATFEPARPALTAATTITVFEALAVYAPVP